MLVHRPVPCCALLHCTLLCCGVLYSADWRRVLSSRLYVQELAHMQQVWQQQNDAAAAAVSAEVQAALRDHIQAQHSGDQQKQQQEEEEGGAPQRQLQLLMRQHKQELLVKVCTPAAAERAGV
jgi:hypothetical protein